MKQIKTLLGYIFQPKAIVFALALYNFVSLWIVHIIRGNNGGLAPPWYFDWYYTNEPSVLLFAATFLLINKFWSYLSSVVLSGFVIIKGAYLIDKFGWIEWTQFLSEQWKTRYELETEILKIWETQLVLAIIIFSTAIFYLIRKTTRKAALQ